ncbi:alpha-galactosidase [Paenibacillus sp. LHD-117]|uniref:alpha-galactosidase n=1 Tax=Paenibacillus sp. LHD-117 TaxID=3071412 RepID=UPI0027DFFD7C|nr:alpha-galactosidase [Paenibacillus sp. LHD-117]MDQ6421657.1 alpha-galactosidase [Paenibacillus sp. LHD-117]
MAITYYEQERLFELRTRRTSYLFGVNGKGTLQHAYWGEQVEAAECAGLLKGRHHSSFDADIDRETEEFGGWGGSHYAEPGLKATFADGVRDLKLGYRGYAITGDDALAIELQDTHYKLLVRVHYKVIEEHDIIERRVTIENRESAPVRIEQAMAAVWAVSGRQRYRMTHVAERWAGEFQLRSAMLTEGKKTIESRRGFTGPHANPWFAIDDGEASETHGDVWFGALGWSGNWKIVAELSAFGHVRVVGGVHDFDGAFSLAPGDAYESPVFVGGYTLRGFGEMSRLLHRYERAHVLPTGELRKVLYNSWEATEFDVRAEEQLELARRAAALGVERFVVDDGWFGARNSDRAGLGDWQVNRDKFPEGLETLIGEVKSLGMEFGLWVEPESVNPDSDLFRRHPEWIYRFPTREGTQLRNQYSLNLGLPEVKDFVLGFMTELLTSYDIKFIKWDMNRTITEPGADDPGMPIWLAHVSHLYEIWAELRTRFPGVEFETCAGGGARIDLGILRYADQAWISDNTDARDRLAIQEGFSYAYSPAVMMCWVTGSPSGLGGRSLPLSYRFHSAMMGGLGIGADIGGWTDTEMEEARGFVAMYQSIRHIVLQGDYYRLAPLGRSNLAAYQYVTEDRSESVAFVFLHAQHFGGEERRIRLEGLQPDAAYEVTANDGEPTALHGSTLMRAGYPIMLRGDYDSWLLRLRRL